MLSASRPMVQAFNQWTDLAKAAAEAGDNKAVLAAWEFFFEQSEMT